MKWFTRFWRDRASARILDSLCALHTKVDAMARTEQDLKNDLDAIQAGVAAAQDSIATLKAQLAGLAANEPVTQDQLDALVGQADAIAASLAPPALTI
jgi:hypothetical protein